jgi:hypothetical protein
MGPSTKIKEKQSDLNFKRIVYLYVLKIIYIF